MAMSVFRALFSEIKETKKRMIRYIYVIRNGEVRVCGRGGGVYCKRCCKLAAVTAEPLQFGEDGKHVGLFWGRYDEPQPVFSGGFLCVQWKSDECKAIVDAALKEGKTWHHSI